MPSGKREDTEVDDYWFDCGLENGDFLPGEKEDFQSICLTRIQFFLSFWTDIDSRVFLISVFLEQVIHKF